MSDLRDAIAEAYDGEESQSKGNETYAQPDTGRPTEEPDGDSGGEDSKISSDHDNRDDQRSAAGHGGAAIDFDGSVPGQEAVYGDGEAGNDRDGVAGGSKAPQSWKPSVREHWQSIPEAVRNEITRRERDTDALMRDTAPLRKVGETLAGLQQRYAPALAAEGVDVLTAASNLMDLSSRLRYGTPVEKAQLAAQIVRSYGVDVEALGMVLSGQMPQPSAPSYSDPRVDSLLAELERMRADQSQRIEDRARGEIESFATGKEYYDDVREDMADLMEMAARRGMTMTLDQAYERACRANPDIDALQRKKIAAAAADKAKAAAVSLKGAPSGNGMAHPDAMPGSVRASLYEALDSLRK